MQYIAFIAFIAAIASTVAATSTTPAGHYTLSGTPTIPAGAVQGANAVFPSCFQTLTTAAGYSFDDVSAACPQDATIARFGSVLAGEVLPVWDPVASILTFTVGTWSVVYVPVATTTTTTIPVQTTTTTTTTVAKEEPTTTTTTTVPGAPIDAATTTTTTTTNAPTDLHVNGAATSFVAAAVAFVAALAL
ncbi:UNVERIFIED_CONTAM: hypothetical protein HDU68_012802 [Siphonaria sp. JEL0065]|nr:hypothetical protein HDU68_012802 [Siphonaria sp. JEL0065]